MTIKKLTAIKHNIVLLQVDVIVNAANSSLLGGGGVDGAIHRAAGAELLHACQLLGGCATGQAKITKGYQLPAQAIIHTVGPVWRGGNHGEAHLLAQCYRASLQLAIENGFKSMAFPNISTGIYGFPIEKAAPIAIQTVHHAIQQKPSSLQEIIFCCFDDASLAIYQQLLEK